MSRLEPRARKELVIKSCHRNMSAKELEASALATHNLSGLEARFSITEYLVYCFVVPVVLSDVDKLLEMAGTLTTPQAGKSKSNRVVRFLERMSCFLVFTFRDNFCFNRRMRPGWLLCTRCGACL